MGESHNEDACARCAAVAQAQAQAQAQGNYNSSSSNNGSRRNSFDHLLSINAPGSARLSGSACGSAAGSRRGTHKLSSVAPTLLVTDGSHFIEGTEQRRAPHILPPLEVDDSLSVSRPELHRSSLEPGQVSELSGRGVQPLVKHAERPSKPELVIPVPKTTKPNPVPPVKRTIPRTPVDRRAQAAGKREVSETGRVKHRRWTPVRKYWEDAEMLWRQQQKEKQRLEGEEEQKKKKKEEEEDMMSWIERQRIMAARRGIVQLRPEAEIEAMRQGLLLVNVQDDEEAPAADDDDAFTHMFTESRLHRLRVLIQSLEIDDELEFEDNTDDLDNIDEDLRQADYHSSDDDEDDDDDDDNNNNNNNNNSNNNNNVNGNGTSTDKYGYHPNYSTGNNTESNGVSIGSVGNNKGGKKKKKKNKEQPLHNMLLLRDFYSIVGPKQEEKYSDMFNVS